ncbi:heme NO-binding domain-containing protein [Kiritimatiellaeota bacterium B1221]|nr:heme NO-binding domain-containing protein [Kiritimatiellaeota bacterium B1221]
MKGIVFVEFGRMVSLKFSEEMLDDLLDHCDLASGGAYTSVGTYDHEELVALVSELSRRTEIPVPGLIKAFGAYLFERFLIHYPYVKVEDNCFSFLASVENTIHVEVKKLYPSAQLPHFEINRPDEKTLTMVYRSDRHFGDLAEGLIEQCILHYGEDITLTREDIDTPDQPVRFILHKK